MEKIDINDVESHRAYQNSVIYENKDSSFDGMFKRTKQLIGEYHLLNKNEYNSNSNYHYYLARLYNFVTIPNMKDFWIDTTKHELRYEQDYIYYFDSVFYHSEKALELDKNNIKAMYLLCVNMYFEKIRVEKYPEYKLPYSYSRNRTLWLNRMSYIMNNSLRFKEIDTTADKSNSIAIAEVGFYFLDLNWSQQGYKMNLKDKYQVATCAVFGDLFDYLKDKKSFFGIDWNIDFIEKNIYPKVLLVRQETERIRELERKKQELQDRLANISFNHKYYYYDPSTSYSSLIELYGESDFTKVSNDGFRFHGTYRIEGDYIYFTYANRSMDINGVIVDADESVAPSKIKYRITDAGRVELIEKDGSVYIEKDR